MLNLNSGSDVSSVPLDLMIILGPSLDKNECNWEVARSIALRYGSLISRLSRQDMSVDDSYSTKPISFAAQHGIRISNAL